MGRRYDTLICKNCRVSNPRTEERIRMGCHRCHTSFPEDEEAYKKFRAKLFAKSRKDAKRDDES